jgi:hypothetical protein
MEPQNKKTRGSKSRAAKNFFVPSLGKGLQKAKPENHRSQKISKFAVLLNDEPHVLKTSGICKLSLHFSGSVCSLPTNN